MTVRDEKIARFMERFCLEFTIAKVTPIMSETFPEAKIGSFSLECTFVNGTAFKFFPTVEECFNAIASLFDSQSAIADRKKS